MPKSTETILPDDDRAAALTTVTGWVSREGQFFGSDERTARWAGATHIRCSECGAVIPKHGWTICPPCHKKRDVAKYAERERRPWDGTQMIYSEAFDAYYPDVEEALEAAEARNTEPTDARFVLCVPQYARTIEADYFCDELPEDNDDIPDELADAMATFNAAVKGVVLSWMPGKYALDLSGTKDE